MSKAFDLDFSNSEELTPKEYVELYETDPQAIETARFVPPKIGEPGFGKIVVVYKDLRVPLVFPLPPK